MVSLARTSVAVTSVLIVITTCGVMSRKPNIIIFLSDDVGWCDVGANDPETAANPIAHDYTPALTSLARRGLVLNQSYVLMTCSPTRAAILTGRYPFKYGMQSGQIKGTYLRWMNESIKLLPESLRELNYTTHAVGKWHLGLCNWRLTPTQRGFDTFYGFLGGAQGYFNHSGKANFTFDFRDNEKVDWDSRGHYSTELFTTRVQSIIKRKKNEPFFIFMAYQNAHDPWEAAPRYVNKYCSHITDSERRRHCGMVAAMDESIGNITKTLEERKIDDDTIILYLSDNGGPAFGEGGSRNWPLRGSKASLWEGGLRTHTILVYPKGLNKVNATWDSLIHATDWFPTFLEAAGVKPRDVVKIKRELQLDGSNQWTPLRKFLPGRRRRLVYNIDDRSNRSSVRIGDLKLLEGDPSSVGQSGWNPPPYLVERGVKEETVSSLPRWHLFNVREDPEERNNLINDPQYAGNVTELKEFLRLQKRKLWPFPALVKQPLGRPMNYGGVWSPGWCCF